jgi:hypothetical protein
MIDPVSLVLTAVGAAASYVSAKAMRAADNAVDAAGEKVLDWIKGKLTGKAAGAAVAELEAAPQSKDAQTELQDLLLARLGREPALADELSALLKGHGIQITRIEQSATQSGTGNKSAQVAGKNNKVDIS